MQLNEFQDLGDLQLKLRSIEDTGPSGVEPLYPDDDKSHVEALEKIRDIVDEHYGEMFDRLCDDDEEVVIERLVLKSDDVPYIEYQVVDKMGEEE